MRSTSYKTYRIASPLAAEVKKISVLVGVGSENEWAEKLLSTFLTPTMPLCRKVFTGLPVVCSGPDIAALIAAFDDSA